MPASPPQSRTSDCSQQRDNISTESSLHLSNLQGQPELPAANEDTIMNMNGNDSFAHLMYSSDLPDVWHYSNEDPLESFTVGSVPNIFGAEGMGSPSQLFNTPSDTHIDGQFSSAMQQVDNLSSPLSQSIGQRNLRSSNDNQTYSLKLPTSVAEHL